MRERGVKRTICGSGADGTDGVESPDQGDSEPD